MRGYIQNEGTQAYFVCQRQVPPGGKVQLDDLFKSVGKKSGLEKTNEEGIILPLAESKVNDCIIFIRDIQDAIRSQAKHVFTPYKGLIRL